MVLGFLFCLSNYFKFNNTELKKKKDLSETLVKAWLNYVAVMSTILLPEIL